MPSTTVESGERTYDFLCANHWADSGTLPGSDVLAEAVSALGGVDEFLIDPILGGVAATVTAGHVLTDEQIGSLVVWADNVHATAQHIAELATFVSYLAREHYMGEELPFNKHGSVTDWKAYLRDSDTLVSFGSNVVDA